MCWRDSLRASFILLPFTGLKFSVLTRDAFHALLALFDENPDRAAEEYELIRAELIRLFRYRGCPSPQDLSDETINRVARKVAQGEIIPRSELPNYFYGVARNVLREYLRHPERTAASADELTQSHHPVEDPDESRRLGEARRRSENRHRCLEECLQKLPPETRALIVSYYEGEERTKIENRQRLAEQMSVSLNSL